MDWAAPDQSLPPGQRSRESDRDNTNVQCHSGLLQVSDREVTIEERCLTNISKNSPRTLLSTNFIDNSCLSVCFSQCMHLFVFTLVGYLPFSYKLCLKRLSTVAGTVRVKAF